MLSGSKQGEADANSIYAEIVRRLASVSSGPPKVERTNIRKLIATLQEQAIRSEEFAKFGLPFALNITELIKSLSTARKDLATIFKIVGPFVDTIRAKLDALQELQDSISGFVATLNSFFKDKTAGFDLRTGVTIRANDGIDLPPADLSSGEKQLLLLFCNTLITEDEETIYLIDEPEISLNIKWQRHLIRSLLDSTKRRKVQFIFATHSFELFAPHEQFVVQLVDRDNETQRRALPKRTIRELVAIHRLEERLHDIIVEGTTDKTLIEWFLKENRRVGFVVYEIGVFEVEAQRVLAHGLEDNNRGRVIALALDVAAAADDNLKVTCIADRDFDLVLGIEHRCPLLLFTDYACMLMYLFNERVLDKYFSFRLRGFPKSARRAVREIAGTLQILFAVHLAKYLMLRDMQPVRWQDSCVLRGEGVWLNLNDYLDRYLNKNSRRARADEFSAKIRECQGRMQFDARYQMRGHDFIAILIWYVAQHPGFRRVGRVSGE